MANPPNTDPESTILINKYASHIKHGTSSQQLDKDLPIPPNLTVKYDNNHKHALDNNTKHHDEHINQQIRINNLNEIDHSKQITIYILYIILFISSGLLLFLLK